MHARFVVLGVLAALGSVAAAFFGVLMTFTMLLLDPAQAFLWLFGMTFVAAVGMVFAMYWIHKGLVEKCQPRVLRRTEDQKTGLVMIDTIPSSPLRPGR